MNTKKVCILSLIASSVLLANETIKLNDIVTIGTKTESTVKNLPMQVDVITAEEIQNSGASNVGEILNSEGTIYLKPTGSNGATMSIRGMAHGDTLILIDGKRVNGEFSKTYELDRIPAGIIERIEVVKGSSSLLYGSDAMGGVINIITKKPTNPFEGNVTVTHGKNKNSIDTTTMGTVGNTTYKLYGGYLKRDAFTKTESTDIKVMQSGAETAPSALVGGGNWATLKSNLNDTYFIERAYQDEMTQKNFGVNIAQKLNDSWNLRADFSYLKEDKNGNYISTMYETNYIQGANKIKAKYVPAEQFDKNNRKTYGLGFDFTPNENLVINYNLNFSKYEKDRKVYTDLWKELGYVSKEDSLSSANQSTMKHTTHDIMGSYKMSNKSKISTGGEYRQTDVQSTAYSVDDRNYKGIFLQHEYQPIDKLHLVYGVRYDKDSIGEDETSFSAGATYEIVENTKIKTNYSQGFRSPDDRELYVDQTSPSGKRMLGASVIDTTSGKTTTWDLKPETSDTIEIGFISGGDIWNFDITAFQTDIKNRISQVTINNTYNTFENISDSKIKGFESSISIVPTDEFMGKISYSRISAKNEIDNTKLSYSPESLASLTLSYFPTSNIELKTITKYVGTQRDDIDEQIKSYDITNFKLIYNDALKNTDFFAGVDNLFSQSIPEELGAIETVNYYIGMKYKF